MTRPHSRRWPSEEYTTYTSSINHSFHCRSFAQTAENTLCCIMPCASAHCIALRCIALCKCKCKGADPLSPMQAGCSFETRCTAFAGEPAAAAAQFCKIETRLCACGPHCDGIALCQTFSVKQVCSLALPMEEVQTITGGKKEETLDERQTREVPTSKIATAVD